MLVSLIVVMKHPILIMWSVTTVDSVILRVYNLLFKKILLCSDFDSYMKEIDGLINRLAKINCGIKLTMLIYQIQNNEIIEKG